MLFAVTIRWKNGSEQLDIQLFKYKFNKFLRQLVKYLSIVYFHENQIIDNCRLGE